MDPQASPAPHYGPRFTAKRILTGAAKAFGEHGLKATTVQDILNAAGVSRRTFYLHFRNIEAVLDALYADSATRLLDTLKRALQKSTTTAEALENTVRAYLNFQREGGERLNLLQVEAMHADSIFAGRRQRTLDLLVNLISRATEVERGIIVDKLYVRACLMGIEGTVNHLWLTRESVSDADWERLYAIATRLLDDSLASK